MAGTDSAHEAADQIAAAALAVPGVLSLHGGSFGEVGTYLPGRRVSGVRLGETTDVHVVAALGSPLPELARAVVAAVEPLALTPVRVVVEDVATPPPGEH